MNSASSTRWCRRGERRAAAERWAETICKNSPMSIRASKQAIQKGLAVSLEQAITEQREYPAVKAMAASQDYIEGPKAFSEKRAPQWLVEECLRHCEQTGRAKRPPDDRLREAIQRAIRRDSLDCFVASA